MAEGCDKPVRGKSQFCKDHIHCLPVLSIPMIATEPPAVTLVGGPDLLPGLLSIAESEVQHQSATASGVRHVSAVVVPMSGPFLPVASGLCMPPSGLGVIGQTAANGELRFQTKTEPLAEQRLDHVPNEFVTGSTQDSAYSAPPGAEAAAAQWSQPAREMQEQNDSLSAQLKAFEHGVRK